MVGTSWTNNVLILSFILKVWFLFFQSFIYSSGNSSLFAVLNLLITSSMMSSCLNSSSQYSPFFKGILIFTFSSSVGSIPFVFVRLKWSIFLYNLNK